MSFEGSDFAMPHPINRIVPNPHVFLDNTILKDKPDYAILVCEIFATWARIEQELDFLLVRLLGPNAAPALAMYETLTAQHLQLGALNAAAKAILPTDELEVFQAATSVAEGAQTPRNHLAHWAWAGCKQRPDLLALADPDMLHQRDFNVAKKVHSNPAELSMLEVYTTNMFVDSKILAYSKSDLERALRDLKEAYMALYFLAMYIDPNYYVNLAHPYPEFRLTREETRSEALERLNGLRLFREALARIRAGRKSTPQSPRGSNPQGLA